MLKEGQHWATSYALKANELYTSFPTKKYMTMKAKELPPRFQGDFKILFGEMFRYFMYLVIKDIIENQLFHQFTNCFVNRHSLSSISFCLSV